jgi:uncharacterized protein YecE (DUF72 family)
VAYVKDLARRFEGIPVVVEFRHGEWLREDIFLFLKEQGLGYVCVDQPQLKGLMPPEARATSKIAYVRFHGRNSQKWWKHRESYERYDYLYAEEELARWVPGIAGLAGQAETVYVSMNNHYRGQAVVNARMIRDMLKAHGEKVL